MPVGTIYDVEEERAPGDWNSIFGAHIDGFVNRDDAKKEVDRLTAEGRKVRAVEVVRRVIHFP